MYIQATRINLMNFAFWFMKVLQSISGFSSQILSTINYNLFPTPTDY